jgi:MerR family transcriptional regulator, mercuric resistance operon regulatory protein
MVGNSEIAHRAKSRIAALDTKIAELESARDALLRLARECSGAARGRCPILTSFETAR